MVRSVAMAGLAAVLAAALVSDGRAQQPPGGKWGQPGDVAYASAAWPALVGARLAGPDRYIAYPAKSDQPHGSVVQIVAGTIEVAGRPARVIIKHNHRGDGLTPAAVYDDPVRHLADIAVMIKREAGYDPANEDWFWTVYAPDGTVRSHQGAPLAGRVDTGTDAGCIGCHKKYGGNDLETLTSK